MTWLTIFLHLIGCGLVLTCSEIRNGEFQSIRQRAEKAKIVVYAKALKTYTSLESKHDHVYTTEFRLLCVLKNSDESIELADSGTSLKPEHASVVNVTEMGYATGWCFSLSAEEGRNYFLFLELDDSTGESEFGEEGKQIPSASGPFKLDKVNREPPIFPDSEDQRNQFEGFLHEGVCPMPSIAPPTPNPTGAATEGRKVDGTAESNKAVSGRIGGDLTPSPAGDEISPSVPEGPPSVPESPPSYPEGPPSYPEGPPGYPESPPSYPEGPSSYPEGPPGYPESPPSYPEGSPINPENPPAVSESKNVAPTAESGAANKRTLPSGKKPVREAKYLLVGTPPPEETTTSAAPHFQHPSQLFILIMPVLYAWLAP